MPSRKHAPAAGGSLNLPANLVSGSDARSAIPDFTKIRVMTINGNREGRTHSAHIANPAKQQFTYRSGKIIMAAQNIKRHKLSRIYLKRAFITT